MRGEVTVRGIASRGLRREERSAVIESKIPVTDRERLGC